MLYCRLIEFSSKDDVFFFKSSLPYCYKRRRNNNENRFVIELECQQREQEK